MFRRILSTLSASAILASSVISTIPAYAAYDTSVEADSPEGFTYSYTLSEDIKKNHLSTTLDESLFDEFLKYSLLVSDKDSLSEEELELCRMVFETERSNVPNLYCPYAREVIKTGTPSKRMKLDELLEDKFMLASMADYSFNIYNNADFSAYYPDIVYNAIVEYWLDDSGKERIVAAPEYEYGPYYEISYDEEPSIDELVEFEIKYDCPAFSYQTDDGAYKVVVELYGKQYKDSLTREVFVSDVWEYVIMHDGSALIVGTTLADEPTVLPTELDGRKVYGIELNNSDITELVVPDGYRYVKLSRMENLKEIEINSPELSVLDIDCPSLEAAVLNVKYISDGAFFSCDSLKTVEIKGAEGIGYSAFRDIPVLDEVTLPDNLRYIGQNAFENTAVSELVIPKSVEVIGVAIPAFESFNVIIIPLIEKPLTVADKDCVIKGYYNTEAHRYALANNHEFMPLDDIEYGDINNDGSTSIADVVVLSKWLKGESDVRLYNWTAADLCRDGKLDAFDLCLIRGKLVDIE